MRSKFFSFSGWFLLVCWALIMQELEFLWGDWSWLSPAWVLVCLLVALDGRERLYDLGMVWFFGLLADVATGTPLGQTALLFVGIACLVRVTFGNFEELEVLSAALLVALLVIIYKVLEAGFALGFGTLLHPATFQYLGTGMTSALLWVGLKSIFRRAPEYQANL